MQNNESLLYESEQVPSSATFQRQRLASRIAWPALWHKVTCGYQTHTVHVRHPPEQHVNTWARQGARHEIQQTDRRACTISLCRSKPSDATRSLMSNASSCETCPTYTHLRHCRAPSMLTALVWLVPTWPPFGTPADMGALRLVASFVQGMQKDRHIRSSLGEFRARDQRARTWVAVSGS